MNENHKHLRHWEPRGGFTRIVSTGDGELQLTEFGIISLRQGEEHCADSGRREIALVILGGLCTISGAGFRFGGIGGRKDVFSGKPHAAYVPCGTAYSIRAESDVEIAWASAPSELETPAFVIAPGQVKEVHLGKENYQRDAHMILTDASPAAHLFIGEAFVPSGNHASFPPHRHDFDNLPVEVDMEELYFFRFNPPQGYGIQKIYTDDRSLDVTCTVRHNDTTLIPRGYHPVVNAPGYTMYYLWVMAGRNHRKFLSVIDPDHRWILGT